MAEHWTQTCKTGTGRASAASTLRQNDCVRLACHPFFLHFDLRRLGRAGQQAAEYGLLIVAISAALTVMYIYAKRGMQATIKDLVTNQIGPQYKGLSTVEPDSYSNVTSAIETLASDQSHVHYEPFSVDSSSNSFSSSTGWSYGMTNAIS